MCISWFLQVRLIDNCNNIETIPVTNIPTIVDNRTWSIQEGNKRSKEWWVWRESQLIESSRPETTNCCGVAFFSSVGKRCAGFQSMIDKAVRGTHRNKGMRYGLEYTDHGHSSQWELHVAGIVGIGSNKCPPEKKHIMKMKHCTVCIGLWAESAGVGSTVFGHQIMFSTSNTRLVSTWVGWWHRCFPWTLRLYWHWLIFLNSMIDLLW